MTTTTIRPVEPSDRDWVIGFLRDRWGSERQVANGEVFYPADHPGFIALVGGVPAGLVTYRIAGDACEITLIDAGSRHEGVGTTLLAATEAAARGHGCSRIWLVTTNDNLDALRFYQRRGFVPVHWSDRVPSSPRYLLWVNTAFPCATNSCWRNGFCRLR
jgi:GNAT superfamily N-acetyltransferase